MSVVHAAAQVVAQATTSPVPSPQVIKETFTQVVPANVPAVVVQAVQLVAMFVSAFLLSVVHWALEKVTAKESGWSSWFNTTLATLYSAGVGLFGAASMHQLGTDSTQLVTLGLSTSVALAGSFWTYAVRKALGKLGSLGATDPTVTMLGTNEDPATNMG